MNDYELDIYNAEPKSLALSPEKDSIIILDSIPKERAVTKEDSLIIAEEINKVTEKFESWIITSAMHAYFDVYSSTDLGPDNNEQIKQIKSEMIDAPELISSIRQMQEQLSSLTITAALASQTDSSFF